MENYAAIIVTFHPDTKHLADMCINLKKQVGHVIIIDNTPGDGRMTYIDDSIHRIVLGDNLGIATAQNIGLQKAMELKCTRCTIFDQDSEVPDDLCLVLSNDMDMLIQNGEKVACIGPRIVDLLENKVENSSDEIMLINNCFATKQIIASGSLFHLEYLNKIGMMEDDLFIDAVDHEWCWRANKLGYKICVSANVYMKHVIGLDRGKVLVWNYIICSPIRHYYQFRNTILLLPRKYVPLKWKIKKIIELILMPFIYIFKGPDRSNRLYYMARGVYDGMIGHVGKIK